MMKKIAQVHLIVLLLAFSSITLLSIRASATNDSEYTEVEPYYLASHMEDFCGKKVRTSGTVHFMASYYMYEDFWLDRTIPVVVRFAGLPTPSKGSFIQVWGTIEYCHLEGGFYYLKADGYGETQAPEFPSLLFSSLFMTAALLAIIFLKRKSK